MNELHAGQTVYAIVFHWPDGSTSWGAMLDGRPGFAETVDADATAIFPERDAALAFVGCYVSTARAFAAVESCTLRSLDEDDDR